MKTNCIKSPCVTTIYGNRMLRAAETRFVNVIVVSQCEVTQALDATHDRVENVLQVCPVEENQLANFMLVTAGANHLPLPFSSWLTSFQDLGGSPSAEKDKLGPTRSPVLKVHGFL